MPLKAKTPSSNPFDNDRDVQSRRTEERPPRHHGNDDEQKHSESSRLPDRATVRGSPKLQQVMNNVKDSHVKSGGNSSIVAVDENDENAVVRFLLSNRVYGYPNSDGSVISNYGLFILNNHPLVSIFFANKHHPYNTKKRFIVFICIISFAIGLAYLFFNTSYIHLVTVCREGCKLVPSSTNSNLPGHCTGGFNDGLSQENFLVFCNYYQPWMLSAICGAILVPYGSLLQLFATCGCFQGKDYFSKSCVGSGVRTIFEICGGGILSFCLALSFGIIVWAVLETYFTKTGYHFFLLFFISKLWSIGDWFIWTLPYFSYRYSIDRRYFYKQLEHIANRNSDICRVESAR